MCEYGFFLFRSTGSYEPDHRIYLLHDVLYMFRSTGSYEPDLSMMFHYPLSDGFDPQALTSLTAGTRGRSKPAGSFDPQALTSLTKADRMAAEADRVFRSTGSYEPDPGKLSRIIGSRLFRSTGSYEPDRRLRKEYKKRGKVSIHRLLRA